MTERRPTVLVTGASGFVGRHVVPLLARNGWVVRRAVRTPPQDANDVMIESLGPSTDWRDALAGVDAVVHLAARVHHKDEEHAIQLYHNVNVAGTLHLARGAIAAGVRDFIFISTILVHGRSNSGRPPFREDDVLTPRGLPAKTDGEPCLPGLWFVGFTPTLGGQLREGSIAARKVAERVAETL